MDQLAIPTVILGKGHIERTHSEPHTTSVKCDAVETARRGISIKYVPEPIQSSLDNVIFFMLLVIEKSVDS